MVVFFFSSTINSDWRLKFYILQGGSRKAEAVVFPAHPWASAHLDPRVAVVLIFRNVRIWIQLESCELSKKKPQL